MVAPASSSEASFLSPLTSCLIPFFGGSGRLSREGVGQAGRHWTRPWALGRTGAEGGVTYMGTPGLALWSGQAVPAAGRASLHWAPGPAPVFGPQFPCRQKPLLEMHCLQMSRHQAFLLGWVDMGAEPGDGLRLGVRGAGCP